MRNITLTPENILRAGEDGTQQDILSHYLALFKRGEAARIPPVFVVENEPAIIRETLESRVRERVEMAILHARNQPKHRLMPKSTTDEIVYLSEFQSMTSIIPISRDQNSVYLGQNFSCRLMNCFRHSGDWNDFIERYNRGEFHPLYIHPDVLRYEGETDIVEVCTRDNSRLTYFGEVLTRQQYEEKTRLLHERQEREMTADIEREFYRFRDIERIVGEYLNRGTEYLLVDGNHRAIAASLSGNNINSLVLSSDKDVQETIRMAESGKIRDFHQRWRTLKELKMSLYDFYAGCIDSISTVQEFVDNFRSSQ